ncbi:spore germination protein [Aquibacillus albus]|uniref:Spore germination protein n=1 Tax=Aquibacillus albus TaxID=1168171 RepID=A0ABS2MYN6_9BACI|nr:spore germination protein [Aquibacillus albus]MBM7571033.1 spore germination protein [Aquibacillus albus]
MFFKYFNNQRKQQNNQLNQSEQEDFKVQLFRTIDENIENIKKLYDSPDDLITRKFTIGNTNQECAIIYIAGLTNKTVIDNRIMQSIQIESVESGKNVEVKGDALLNTLHEKVLHSSVSKVVNNLDEVSLAILSGDTALFVNGTDKVLILGTKGWENRSIEEPISEGLIRGPREGFIENIRTNTVLVRRRVRDSNLRFKAYQVGRRSKKQLVVSYIEGIVNPDLVKELNRRLESIDLDDAPESGYIEQWIEDDFLSPFPQLSHTERPDKVASALDQGKIAILLDGTPFVLIAPMTFGNTLQSPEDYYERWIVSSLIRYLRYVAAFIAVFLPSLYIALVSFHPGMIPSKLAFSLAATREGVPFPALIEALLMEATMELLREAGIRLPKPIGQTIGIVGGLVIGEAAVRAGIVSPVMVIIVALTAIASFSMPSYGMALSFRMLRFGFMLIASVLGLYGIILGYIALNIHLVNLKSLGVPYSAPFAPSFYGDWKDLVIRAPITMLTKRPKYTQTGDTERMDNKGGNST